MAPAKATNVGELVRHCMINGRNLRLTTWRCYRWVKVEQEKEDDRLVWVATVHRLGRSDRAPLLRWSHNLTDWLGTSHHDRVGREHREALISAGDELWRLANSTHSHR